MRLRPGIRPDPAGEAYSATPYPLAGNGESPPKGGGKGRGGEGRGEEGREEDGWGKGEGRANPRTKILATALRVASRGQK